MVKKSVSKANKFSSDPKVIAKLEKEDKKNADLCSGCEECCRYVNIGIAPPKTQEDYDYIVWYLLHENVYVWVGKKNTWYVKFITKCKPLKKGKCISYQTRPMVCREYTQKKCEKDNLIKDEVMSFHSVKEFVDYLKANKKRFYGFYE
ncbi:MAG: YkgJ family cysteine cluster protein [Candidatus Woesearchaeota archaeon]|jgi:Fe-S-cluster containining protein